MHSGLTVIDAAVPPRVPCRLANMVSCRPTLVLSAGWGSSCWAAVRMQTCACTGACCMLGPSMVRPAAKSCHHGSSDLQPVGAPPCLPHRTPAAACLPHCLQLVGAAMVAISWADLSGPTATHGKVRTCGLQCCAAWAAASVMAVVYEYLGCCDDGSSAASPAANGLQDEKWATAYPECLATTVQARPPAPHC